MANTIGDFTTSEMAALALIGLGPAITSYKMFSTNLTDTMIDDGTTLKVAKLTRGTVGADVGEWNIASNNYGDATDITSVAVPLTLTNRPKSTFSLSGDEEVKLGMTPEEYIMDRGALVGQYGLELIYAELTAAKFPLLAFSGAASTFDRVDVAGMRGAQKALGWGDRRPYKMQLNTAFYGALEVDTSITNFSESQNKSAFDKGVVPMISNHEVQEVSYLPVNGAEVIQGFTTDGFAIGVVSGLPAMATGIDRVLDIGTATDDSGFTIQVVKFADGNTGKVYYTVEYKLGFAILDNQRLRRITT